MTNNVSLTGGRSGVGLRAGHCRALFRHLPRLLLLHHLEKVRVVSRNSFGMSNTDHVISSKATYLLFLVSMVRPPS